MKVLLNHDYTRELTTTRDKDTAITEDTAYQILAMDGQAYSKTLLELSEKIAQTETPTDAQGK